MKLDKFWIRGCFYDAGRKSDLEKGQLLGLRNSKLLKIMYFTEIVFFLYKITNFFRTFLNSSLQIFLTMQNLNEPIINSFYDFYYNIISRLLKMKVFLFMFL